MSDDGRTLGRAAKGEAPWVEEVLHFWFGELTEPQWWRKDAAVDALVRARFESLHDRLSDPGAPPPRTPREALAMVIVLDQFPRNMYRGDPRAFATDARARHATLAAVAAGFDRALPDEARLFLYMPLQHSEDAADQRLACELCSSLGNDNWTHFAVAHKRIIDRFGRFPHRNAILGRASTPEEIELLKDPRASF